MRTKYPVKKVHGYGLQNMGGHLINPPIKCLHRKQAHDCKNTTWADLSICNTCTVSCMMFERYKAMDHEKRVQYLRNNGVII